MRPLNGSRAAVDAALEEWAKWCHDGAAQLGWPRATLLARVIRWGFTGASQAGPLPEMPEDVLRVEQAVLRLKNIEQQVVKKHYLYWQPIEVSARHCHMSPNRFRVLLHRARNNLSHALAL